MCQQPYRMSIFWSIFRHAARAFTTKSFSIKFYIYKYLSRTYTTRRIQIISLWKHIIENKILYAAAANERKCISYLCTYMYEINGGAEAARQQVRAMTPARASLMPLILERICPIKLKACLLFVRCSRVFRILELNKKIN